MLAWKGIGVLRFIPLNMSPDLPVAVPLILVVLLHVLTLGYWAARAIGFRSEDFWTKVAVVGGLGYTLLGAEMFVLGHLGGLQRTPIIVSAVVMGAGFALARRRWTGYLREFCRQLRDLGLENPVMLGSVAVFVCFMFFSGTRPSMLREGLHFPDDDYHFGAPLIWASLGRWEHSPFRMMDAAAMMEMLYTIGAIFHSPTAGHWTQALLVVFMLPALAGIAKATGGNRPAYLAAVLAIPVVGSQAASMGSDVPVVAFCIMAFAAMFQGDRGKTAGSDLSIQTALTAGALFAGAFSSKNLGSLPALAAALVYAISPTFDRRALAGPELKRSLARVSLIVFPVVLVISAWAAHCYFLSGHLWDSREMVFTTDPNDWRWTSGAAVGHIPCPIDWLMIPVLPFYFSIFGQREPYGGRTGLLLAAFVWVGIAALKSLKRDQRLHAVWMIGSGLFYYLVLSPVIVKTRFLAFSWTAMSALAAVGYNALQRQSKRPLCRFGIALFTLLVWIGMLDGVRKMMLGLILLLPTTME